MAYIILVLKHFKTNDFATCHVTSSIFTSTSLPPHAFQCYRLFLWATTQETKTWTASKESLRTDTGRAFFKRMRLRGRKTKDLFPDHLLEEWQRHGPEFSPRRSETKEEYFHSEWASGRKLLDESMEHMIYSLSQLAFLTFGTVTIQSS